MAKSTKTVVIPSSDGLGEGQCHFYVLRKKRFCRMTVKPNRNYCGEHEPKPKTEDGQDDTRIPCPLDSKHTCYASKLEKHLSICNAKQGDVPPYLIQNINAPPPVNEPPRLLLSDIPRDTVQKVVEKINKLYDMHIKDQITTVPTQPIHSSVLPEFGESFRTENSLRHLRQVSSLLHIAESSGLVEDQTCYVELGAGKGQLSYYLGVSWCNNKSRVLSVDRAALRHKRDNRLRSERRTKEEFSRSYDKEASRSNKEVLRNEEGSGSYEDKEASVNDKETYINNNEATRNKGLSGSNKEASINCGKKAGRTVKKSSKNNDEEASRSLEGDNDEVAVRLRADLAHLALEKVPVVSSCRKVVGFAKHLCGVATDYALRCITSAGVLSRCAGAVLATCCHHRCDVAPYVANRHLLDLGISSEELNTMLGVVSWATCGDGRSRELRNIHSTLDENQDIIPSLNITEIENCSMEVKLKNREYREKVGRKAKLLIDWGRVLYLREKGFDASLCYYVSTSVSLENVCIVAKKI